MCVTLTRIARLAPPYAREDGLFDFLCPGFRYFFAFLGHRKSGECLVYCLSSLVANVMSHSYDRDTKIFTFPLSFQQEIEVSQRLYGMTSLIQRGDLPPVPPNRQDPKNSPAATPSALSPGTGKVAFALYGLYS